VVNITMVVWVFPLSLQCVRQNLQCMPDNDVSQCCQLGGTWWTLLLERVRRFLGHVKHMLLFYGIPACQAEFTNICFICGLSLCYKYHMCETIRTSMLLTLWFFGWLGLHLSVGKNIIFS
jgi:hypothetical protein